MSDVLNVYAAEPAATGTIFVGALDTPGPESAIDDLDLGFIDLGDVGEDGFSEKPDRKIDKKRNFGGRVVKVLQKEFSLTYELVFLESLNADVLKAVYGANNVTVTPATADHGAQVEVRKNAKKLPHLSWVIDTIDSELGARYRTYVPNGQIFDTGEVKIVHTDTIEYKVTIEVFQDEAGEFAYSWSDDGRPLTGS